VTALHGDVGALELSDLWGTWAPDAREPVPPPEAGWRHPAALVVAFDNHAGEPVWHSLAVGTTRAPDPRVGLSRVVAEALASFPSSRAPSHRPRAADGRLGVRLQMQTEDGDLFLPTVVAVSAGLPADGALAVGDALVEIEGRSVANLPLVELNDLLRGPPETTVRLRVRSGDHERVLYLRRAAGNA
jgi:hypothetical protein